MESITIGQIALVIAFLVAFIKGIEYLYVLSSKGAEKWFKRLLKPMEDKLDTIDAKTNSIDLGACKNFLVRFLADVEQENKIDEVEKERFYEVYEHYTKLGGNSYIHDKVEKLKKENKL